MPRTVPQGGRLRGRRLGPYTGCRMPELPDVTVYLEALDGRIRGARLERLRLANPFVLRSVDPSPAALAAHDPGGLELFEADLATFRAALTRESHTLKRSLTDPRILSGVGNAYSDEILHRERLSPVRMTRQLSEEETA